MSDEINNRILTGIKHTLQILHKNKTFSRITKLKVYNTLIKLAVTYSAKSWVQKTMKMH